MLTLNYAEMSNEQRRQLIDAQQAHAVFWPASLDLNRMGSLIVSTSRGKQYVYEAHGKPRQCQDGNAHPWQRIPQRVFHDKILR